MAEPTKIVKGGFRATLALVISVVALIFSILAYTSSGREAELRTRIQDLQAAMEKVKTESAVQLEKLRNETAEILNTMSETIKKQSTEDAQKSTEAPN
jgi:uncharacterized membrane protein (DUF106 family)